MRPLGVALIWWPELDPLCRTGEGLVDAIEAEPETFWAPATAERGVRSYLRAALAHLPQPKLLHGVAAPLGGTCRASPEHALLLAKDITDLEPEFVSEHL